MSDIVKQADDLTDEQFVEDWVHAGIPHKAIADALGLDLSDLRKMFPLQLDLVQPAALAQVGKTAFNMAVSGEHPTMTKFYLEVRGGKPWNKELQRMEQDDDGRHVLNVTLEGEFEDQTAQQHIGHEDAESQTNVQLNAQAKEPIPVSE